MRKIILGVIFISVLILTGCPDPAPGGGGSVVNVIGVSVSSAAETIDDGYTVQLSAVLNPADASNKNVTWSSSNEAAATVSATGLVTGVDPGSSTITVTTVEGSFTATCAVTIINVPVTGITLNSAIETLVTGDDFQFTANITPSNASNKNVSWESSNTSIVTITQNGLATGVAAGVATIAATTEDGNIDAVASITVLAYVPITGITLYDSDNQTDGLQTIENYSNSKFELHYTPSNATVKDITITIADESKIENSYTDLVANVMEIYMDGLTVGTTSFTVTCDDNLSLSSTVTVEVVDTTIPKLVTECVVINSTEIIFAFSEPMGIAGLFNTANYTLTYDPAGAGTEISISSIISNDNEFITITTSSPLNLGNYSFEANNVVDLVDNAIDITANSINFIVAENHNCTVDLAYVNETAGVFTFDAGAITFPSSPNWVTGSFYVYISPGGEDFNPLSVVGFGVFIADGSCNTFYALPGMASMVLSNGNYQFVVSAIYDLDGDFSDDGDQAAVLGSPVAFSVPLL